MAALPFIKVSTGSVIGQARYLADLLTSRAIKTRYWQRYHSALVSRLGS